MDSLPGDIKMRVDVCLRDTHVLAGDRALGDTTIREQGTLKIGDNIAKVWSSPQG